MNLKTAARQLGVHYQTAYRWVRSGQIVAVKVGAGYEISEAALTRFQTQRAAMSRAPEMPERSADLASAGERATTGNVALEQFAEMVRCTTIDVSAVLERAARVLADVIGDAATVSLCEGDGSLRIAAFGHRDPERAVAMGAVLAFGNADQPFARRAASSGETVFVPQVPQHDVRRRVRPEFHQCLTTASMYSVVSAPIVGNGIVRGSVLVSRDAPGNPYTIEDRDLVVALASHIGVAIAQAELGRAAWSLRAHLVADLTEWVRGREFDRAREWLVEEVADTDPVAVVNLDMEIDGATAAFAQLFDATASELKELSLRDITGPEQLVHETFQALRDGELDYCTIVTQPLAVTARSVVVHGAIVRMADATPCCVVYVAHESPLAREQPQAV